MPTIKEMIEGSVYAPLGAPALPAELEIQAIDFYNALTKYYTYLPIKIERSYNMFNSGREHRQVISELLKTPDYFYLGVVGYAPRYQVGQYRFDEYLLGLNYSVPIYDPLKKQATDAYIDQNTGDPYFNEVLDDDEPYIQWVVGGFCTLGVQYGLGQNNVEKIPRRHFELVSKLVGMSYYQRLISIRKTGNFSKSDFSIDISFLEKVLEQVSKDGMDMLTSMAPYPLTIG